MENKNKLFGYVPSLSDFNKLKVSADIDNKTYTIGGGSVQQCAEGEVPDIRWHIVVFIGDVTRIWTHGKFYASANAKLSDDYASPVYVEVKDLETGEVLFNPAKPGETIEEAILQLDTNVANLLAEILKNEEVVSKALNEHNLASGFNDNGKYIQQTTAKYISGATSLADADNLLDAAISSIAANVEALSGNLSGLFIPTKTSDLTNDSGYITSAAIPTKVSAFENDAKYAYQGNIPTKVSQLENDSKYLTSYYVPTKVSEFNNDAKYQTESDVKAAIDGLINGAPGTLDTLGEIAEILSENTDGIGALVEELAKKANTTDVNATLDNKADKSTVTALSETVDDVKEAIDSITGSTNNVYTANGSAQYISDATSLKDADNKLDAAIAGVASELSNLSTEVSKIEIPKKVSAFENDAKYAYQGDIPTKVSQLENDSKYLTSYYVPTKVSAFENDANYATKSEIPTKLGQLTNDANYAKSSEIPTTTGQLTNNSGFITMSDVEAKKYITIDQVPEVSVPQNLSAFINDVGYITLAQVPEVSKDLSQYDNTTSKFVSESELAGKNYITISDVEDKNYITMDDVEDKNYITMSEVEAKDYATKSELPTVPTKVSQLENDANYITLADVPEVSKDLSQYDNSTSNFISKSELEAKNYATKSELPTVPTKVSQLENDANYITLADVPEVDKDLSQYDNTTSKFVSESELTNKNYITIGDVESKNYITMDEVEAKKYITLADVPEVSKDLSQYDNSTSKFVSESELEAKDYATKSELPIVPTNVSAFNNDAGYITSAAIPANVSAFNNDAGYITSAAIPTNVSTFTNDAQYMTSSEVEAKVASLVDSAPETLNTLNELAAALGDDPNFATTVSTEIGKKADSTYVATELEKKANNTLTQDSKVYPEVTNLETQEMLFTNIVAGDTLEAAILKTDANTATLVEEVLKNEDVISTALNVHNISAGFTENGKYEQQTDSNYISGATSLADADNLLDAAIKNVETSVANIHIPTNVSEFTNDAGYITLNEVPEAPTHGGYLYLEDFDNTNLQNALTLALASLEEGEDAIIDCTYFKGEHTVTGDGFVINNPVKLVFGGIDIIHDNANGTNLFTFNTNNISIVGLNRNTDKSKIDNGATIFRMTNPDTTLNGYHIKSRGNKNLEIKDITFVGLRTTHGRQYNNASYPLDGVGGIYIEKAKPETTEAHNTCNNVRIENILIAGSKAHGIYIDTPILSTFKNIRLSDCGGHGIFVNGGTSLLLENIYSSSANFAGFCIYGATYVSLNNCVSENSGIGFWIRSSFNVTLTSPGVEETRTYGNEPWRLSQPISGKYGLGLTTLASDNSTVVDIVDVTQTASNYFIGYGILITGGRSINIFTPYIKSLAVPIITEAYPSGISRSTKVKYINVLDNNRETYILNPSFKEASDSEIPGYIKHEIGIAAEVEHLELVYSTDETILTGTLDSPTYVTNSDLRAPIYCKSPSSVIRSGKSIVTNYSTPNVPATNYEFANKEYVDSQVAAKAPYSISYNGATYPEVDDINSETEGTTYIFVNTYEGTSLEQYVRNVDDNVARLVQECLDTEFVVSSALNQFNISAGFDEQVKYVQNASAQYISSATSLADADNLLDSAILAVANSVEQKIGNIDFSTYVTKQQLVNAAYVTSSALTAFNYADKAYVSSYIGQEIANLVNTAPEALDTLNELAAALGDDPNFSNTVMTEIGTKASITYVTTELEKKASSTVSGEFDEYPVLKNTHTGEELFVNCHDGIAVSDAIHNIDKNTYTLVGEIIKNEEVISNAFSKINTSAGFDENANFVVKENANVIGGATNLTEAINLLDENIGNLSIERDGAYFPIVRDITTEEEKYLFSYLYAGDSITDAIYKTDSNVATLAYEVVRNEYVVSAFAYQINNSIGLNEYAEYVPKSSANYISDAKSLVDADNKLDAAIKSTADTINSLNDAISNIDIPTTVAELTDSSDYYKKSELTRVSQLYNDSEYQRKSEVESTISTYIANIVNSAPETLDTLNELATALGNDENFATNVTNQIASKANKTITGDSVKYREIQDINNPGTYFFINSYDGIELEQFVRNVDANTATLVNEVCKNEKVISTAINQLNISSGFGEDAKYITNTTATYISSATSLAEADNMLDSAISDVYSALSNYVTDSELANYATKAEVSVKADNVLGSDYTAVEYQKIVNVNNTETEEILFNPVVAGDTIANAIKKLDQNISTLVDETVKNELVVATAVNVLNESCGFGTNAKYVQYTDGYAIADAKSLYAAIIALDAKLQAVANAAGVSI